MPVTRTVPVKRMIMIISYRDPTVTPAVLTQAGRGRAPGPQAARAARHAVASGPLAPGLERAQSHPSYVDRSHPR